MTTIIDAVIDRIATHTIPTLSRGHVLRINLDAGLNEVRREVLSRHEAVAILRRGSLAAAAMEAQRHEPGKSTLVFFYGPRTVRQATPTTPSGLRVVG
jgi:hypothetical protein